MKMKLGRYMLCGLALVSATKDINAGELVDPPVFASSKDDKTLDLLMIAKPAVIGALPGVVTGWVYEICERKYSVENTCRRGIFGSKSNQHTYTRHAGIA
jgi:hypothetical protein